MYCYALRVNFSLIRSPLQKSGGGGGATGGLNLPLPVAFDPGSRPVFVCSRLFALRRLRNIVHCCVIFPFFSRFSPSWESRFPPPLLSPPVHLPSPFLPVFRPLSPSQKNLKCDHGDIGAVWLSFV